MGWRVSRSRSVSAEGRGTEARDSHLKLGGDAMWSPRNGEAAGGDAAPPLGPPLSRSAIPRHSPGHPGGARRGGGGGGSGGEGGGGAARGRRRAGLGLDPSARPQLRRSAIPDGTQLSGLAGAPPRAPPGSGRGLVRPAPPRPPAPPTRALRGAEVVARAAPGAWPSFTLNHTRIICLLPLPQSAPPLVPFQALLVGGGGPSVQVSGKEFRDQAPGALLGPLQQPKADWKGGQWKKTKVRCPECAPRTGRFGVWPPK